MTDDPSLDLLRHEIAWALVKYTHPHDPVWAFNTQEREWALGDTDRMLAPYLEERAKDKSDG